MAKEVKILLFRTSGPNLSEGRGVKGQFVTSYYDYPNIEAEIGRYLAAGFIIVGCNWSSTQYASTYTVTLQR